MAGTAKQDVSTSDLAAVVGILAEEAQERRDSKQVPVSLAKLPTPFNPEGVAVRKVKLTWKYVTQNGARMNPELLRDREIELLNQVRPGTYHGKKIQVLKRRDKSIDIRYANKSFEQRMDFKNYARDMTELLEKILTEQEAQKQRRASGQFVDDDE